MDLEKMLMDYAKGNKEANNEVNEVELEVPVEQEYRTKREIELENYVKRQIDSGELVLDTVEDDDGNEEIIAYLKGYSTPLTKLMTFTEEDMQFATPLEREEYARFNKENDIIEVRVNTVDYLNSLVDDAF